MSKPQSIKSEPWTSFAKTSYFLFTDDFPHEKLLTAKVNLKSSRGTVNLKNVLERKGEAFKSVGEIKLWFPVWSTRNGSLYFRAKNNELKLHYDDGVKAANFWKFQNVNLYGSYQSQKNFKNIVLKAGANLIAENFNVDQRVRAQLGQNGENDYSYAIKSTLKREKWTLDWHDVLGLKQLSLINNSLRYAYRLDDNEFFFRAENKRTRNFEGFNFANLDSYYEKFILDYVRKVDSNTKVALQSDFTRKGFGKASFLLRRTFQNDDLIAKIKGSSDKSFALSVQSVLKDYGKWTAGVEVSDIGGENSVRYGFQVQLNL